VLAHVQYVHGGERERKKGIYAGKKKKKRGE
jgi:hypothetical protein